MPEALQTALTTGINDLKNVFQSGVILAVPVGFSIWAIKVAVRVVPSMVRGFISR
jgi:uncharacterized membrane protein